MLYLSPRRQRKERASKVLNKTVLLIILVLGWENLSAQEQTLQVSREIVEHAIAKFEKHYALKCRSKVISPTVEFFTCSDSSQNPAVDLSVSYREPMHKKGASVSSIQLTPRGKFRATNVRRMMKDSWNGKAGAQLFGQELFDYVIAELTDGRDLLVLKKPAFVFGAVYRVRTKENFQGPNLLTASLEISWKLTFRSLSSGRFNFKLAQFPEYFRKISFIEIQN